MPKTFKKVLKNVSRVAVWGDILSDGSPDTLKSILQTNRPIQFMAVGSDRNFTAIDENGIIIAWGNGQTDIDQQSWASYPIPRTAGWKKISTKMYLVVGLHSDGHIEQWGGTDFVVNYPPPSGTFIDVAATNAKALAVKSDGTLVAWGNIDTEDPNDIGNVPSGNNYIAVDCGQQDFAIALKSDGTVVTWGYNPSGRYDVPVGLSGVVKIMAGAFHSVALKSDGSIVCWGFNAYGECEVPEEEENTVFIDIAAGAYYSAGLREDGSICVWANTTSVAANCPKGYNFSKIFSGLNHCLAIKRIFTPKLHHFDPTKNKIFRIEVAKYDEAYTGDLEVTFKGIVTNPADWPAVDFIDEYHRDKAWRDPNKTFIVPHATNETPPRNQLYGNYRWRVDENYYYNDTELYRAWDGWVVEFAPTNRYMQSDCNGGSVELTPGILSRIGPGGYLSMRWCTQVGGIYCVFAANSYGPAEINQEYHGYMWSPRSILGRPTVDVTARRRTWYAAYGGPLPDRIMVKIPNLIKKQDTIDAAFEFIAESAVKYFHIQLSDSGTAWRERNFDYSSWQHGTGGVGYARPEFKLKEYLEGEQVMGHGVTAFGKVYECKADYTPIDNSTRPTDGGGTEWAIHWAAMGILTGDYFDLISTFIGPDMFDINASCCLVIPFNVASQSIVDSLYALTLSVRYDAGFVAFLNGTQIASSNAPSPLLWNSTATTSHEATSALEDFNILAHKDLLVEGHNVLTVQCLNKSIDSDKFVFNAKLTGATSAECFTTTLPYLGGVSGYGGNAEIVANGMFKDGIF